MSLNNIIQAVKRNTKTETSSSHQVHHLSLFGSIVVKPVILPSDPTIAYYEPFLSYLRKTQPSWAEA